MPLRLCHASAYAKSDEAVTVVFFLFHFLGVCRRRRSLPSPALSAKEMQEGRLMRLAAYAYEVLVGLAYCRFRRSR